jgi:Arylsulfotransferase (ASST)
MRLRSVRLVQRATGAFGMAALVLAIGALSGTAPGQDAARPPQRKDQPGAAPAQGKDDTAKKDEGKPAPPKLGLLINDPKALQGYTLISPFDSSQAFLFDMQGRVVRSWETGCGPALSAFLLENGHLMRPGSIGSDARVFGPGPGVGGRIQEFTWEGELVWDFKFYNAKQLPHHNMTILPNGNVLLIVWDRKTAPEAIAAGRRPEMTGDRHLLVDSLIEIKPTGKTTGEVVWEWHLWDHLVQDFDQTKANFASVAGHPELVNINYGEDDLPSVIAAREAKEKGKVKADGKADAKADARPTANRPPRIDPDYTHFNGVAYHPDLDQIAVSVWHFSEFWIIDHSTTAAQAAGHAGGRAGKGGDLLYRWGNPQAYRAGTKADRKLFSQHNAHWIAKGHPGAGHLLLFNNGPGRPDGSYSSVDELVLPADSQGRYTLQPGKAYGPDGPVWSYTAPKKTEFYSSFISGAQRLSNGNTLICSGANGTIFEVTSDKTIVWKYVNPVKVDTPIGPPPRPGQIMAPVAGEMLGISPDQRKLLDEIQKDIDAHLDKLLTADQKKQSSQWPQPTGGAGFFYPSSQPGQVMAGPEQTRLKLTDDQKKDVLALQKAIAVRFDRVLTAAQRNQIKSVFAPQGGPPGGPGPGQGPGDPQQPGKIFSAAQQNTLKLSAAQKQRLVEIQKEVDARLETLLTEDQKQQLASMQRGAGGGPFQSGPPGGRPIFRALRYAKDFPGFAGKDLKSGKSLEELFRDDAKKKQADKKP